MHRSCTNFNLSLLSRSGWVRNLHFLFRVCTINKVGSAYIWPIRQICKIWTLSYFAYTKWLLHILCHIFCHILHISCHIFWHILHILRCILYIFVHILHILLRILHIIMHIMHINDHILHIILHIWYIHLHMMHISLYILHIYLHILYMFLHILHICMHILKWIGSNSSIAQVQWLFSLATPSR